VHDIPRLVVFGNSSVPRGVMCSLDKRDA
jgi:hypothetical protein